MKLPFSEKIKQIFGLGKRLIQSFLMNSLTLLLRVMLAQKQRSSLLKVQKKFVVKKISQKKTMFFLC